MLNTDGNRKQVVNISGDAFRNIAKSFYTAIDNKDQDIFYVLNSFVYERLYKTFEKDNIHSFEQFSNLLVWYYEYALDKISSSTTNYDITKICAEASASGLRSKLSYGFNFGFDNRISLEEKKRINIYAKVIVNRFAELINTCIRAKDLSNLSFILNELQQCSNSYNHKLTDLKFNIRIRKASYTADEIASMEEQLEVEGFIDNSVRLLFKATMFWCYYLFQIEQLNSEQLNRIIKEFNGYRGFVQRDFVDDLLILLDFGREAEYAWSRWDFMKRPSGVTYSPPSVHDWVPFGAFIYSLQTRTPFYRDLEETDPRQLSNLEGLLNSLISVSGRFPENIWMKWQDILGIASEEQFKKRVTELESQLQGLQKKAIENKDREIAALPLDNERRNNVINIMSEAWYKNSQVHQLFEFFGNVENVASEKQVNGQVGYKGRIWEGIKKSLIDHDQYHVPVFGIETHGEQLAGREEDVFFDAILKQTEPQENLMAKLDEGITAMIRKRLSPSLIICGYDLWNRYFRELKSKNFIFESSADATPFKNYGGTYKELPIAYFYSDLIANTVVVSDFANAFTLRQQSEPSLFKEVLHTHIIEITQEEAEGIVNKYPQYWETNGNREEAIVRVRNSILVDFYLKEEFRVINKDAYSIISI